MVAVGAVVVEVSVVGVVAGNGSSCATNQEYSGLAFRLAINSDFGLWLSIIPFSVSSQSDCAFKTS